MKRHIIAAVAASTLAVAAAAQDWQEFGPAPISNVSYSGRISSIACSPTDANRYFVAGADGGVWRTTDGGQTWQPLTDHMPTTAIGAIALDPTDENTIYAGTGEANFANHSRYGLGVYKSTDGGDSWVHLAEATFAGRCFSKIVIDHLDSDILYASITRAGGFPELAAAKGHPGATGAVGVFKSTDGGATWGHLTNGLPALSATDLAIDPVDPDILYAAIGRIFGHPDNGLYKSIDGGASWSKLGGGLPSSSVGRTTVAIAPSDRTRLYAMFVSDATSTGGGADTIGAFRSDNAGATWTSIPVGSIQSSYGWYLSVVGVHPTDPDIALFGGVSLRRTTNAGSSFSTVTPPHVDLHALAWDAAGRLLAGDDGGVHRSTNDGSSWIALNDTLGLIQFYAGLSTHPSDPDILFGGTQDNGSNRRTTNTRNWTQVFGGDGGWTALDQQSPSRVFVEFQGTGNIYRSTNGGDSFSGSGSGISGGDRNCFLPPFLINALDSNRMLYATHRIYRSTNGGGSWSPVSGDLSDGNGAIRALAQSTTDPEVVYAATNDGNVHVSFDEGATFQQILNDHDGWPRVTRELEVSAFNPLRMYAAGAVFGVDQIQRTQDAGQTWDALDGDLPDVPVNVIAENDMLAGQIFAGTDSGLFVTFDDGATWSRYGEGMPNAPVVDIRLDHQFGRIVASTQGRGVWSAPLVPMRAELANFAIVYGTHLSGDLDDLEQIDDFTLRVRSQFGFSVLTANIVEIAMDATSPLASPETLQLALRARLNNPGGTARLRLRNWTSGRLEDVDMYPLSTSMTLRRTLGIPADDYVRSGDNRIECSLRMVVIATFDVTGFRAITDLMQIAAE